MAVDGEAKAKVQTTTKCIVMHKLEQVPKGKNGVKVNDSKFKNSYWDKVLCKTVITL